MRLPTTVRYGARAMTELAAAHPQRAVSVREVAENQSISAKYLEHILNALRAAGLVEAVRGKRGGYVLARPPRSITLKDLFESLAGPAVPVPCVDYPNSCPMQDTCPTQETWVEIKQAVERVLERTTIQDLVERKKQRQELHRGPATSLGILRYTLPCGGTAHVTRKPSPEEKPVTHPGRSPREEVGA